MADLPNELLDDDRAPWREPAGLDLSEAALRRPAPDARAESARSMRPTWLAIQASLRKAHHA